MQRCADGGQRPLTPRRVGHRDSGGRATRVIAGEHLIAGTVPAIVALVVGRRNSGPDVRPPRDGRRVDLERLELDEVSRDALTLARHAEAHRGLSVDVGKDEAALIEAETGQRRCSATIPSAQIGAGANDGIALSLIDAAPGRHESLADGRPEEIRDARLPAGAKVQHAAASRMPRLTAREVDVDVVLVGDVRPENVQDVDLSRRRRGGISLALVVGAQWFLVRMSSSVGAGDTRHGRVGENDGAIAGQ